MSTIRLTVTVTLGLVLVCQDHVFSVLVNSTVQPDNERVNIQLSRQHLIPALCDVSAYFTEDDVIRNNHFLESRGIVASHESTITDLKKVLHLRRLDVLSCCQSETLHLSVQCLYNVRRRRIDYLCANKTTENLSYTYLRRPFMVNRTKECCHRLGDLRYRCYNESSMPDTSSGNNVFSLDETDPVNDIWDYPVNSSFVEKMAWSVFNKTGDISLQKSRALRKAHSHCQRRRHLNQVNDTGCRKPGRHSTSRQQSSFPTVVQTPGQETVPEIGGNQNQTTPISLSLQTVVLTSSPRSVTGDHDGPLQYSAAVLGKKPGTRAQTIQSGIIRHPGAILETHRNNALLRRTTTEIVVPSSTPRVSREGSFQDVISHVKGDLAGMQEKWWVRGPMSLRKSPKTHQKTKANDAGRLSLSDLFKQRSFTTGHLSGFEQKRDVQSTTPSGRMVQISNSTYKPRIYRKGTRTRKKHDQTKRVENGNGLRPSLKTKCKFTVLTAEDIQEANLGLLEILKRKYKIDVWHV